MTKLPQLILTALLAAFTLLFALIPQLGFIQIGFVSFTIVHVFVLIAIICLPLGGSLVVGFTFGLSSMVASYLYGTTPLDLLFQNPFIAILPRVGFVFYTYGLWLIVKKINQSKICGYLQLFTFFMAFSILLLLANQWVARITNHAIWGSVFCLLFSAYFGFLLGEIRFKKINNIIFIVSVGGTIIHTFLVLLTLSIFISPLISTTFLTFLQAVIASNLLFECIIAVILVGQYSHLINRWKGFDHAFIN